MTFCRIYYSLNSIYDFEMVIGFLIDANQYFIFMIQVFIAAESVFLKISSEK